VAGVRKPPMNETAEMSGPISGRYGDLACADRAGRSCEAGIGADRWGETVSQGGPEASI
jgi:hypothetical protein